MESYFLPKVEWPKGQWWCQGCACLGAPPSTGLSPKGKAGRWGFPTSHRESGGSAMNHTEITCRTAQHFSPVAPHQLLSLPHRVGTDPCPGAVSKTLHRHGDNPASPSLVCVCVCVAGKEVAGLSSLLPPLPVVHFWAKSICFGFM